MQNFDGSKEQQTLKLVEEAGHDGLTAWELGHLEDGNHGTISGRLSSLARKGYVVRLKESRNGKDAKGELHSSSVYVATKYVNGRNHYPRPDGVRRPMLPSVEQIKGSPDVAPQVTTAALQPDGYSKGYRDGYRDAVRDMMDERRLIERAGVHGR